MEIVAKKTAVVYVVAGIMAFVGISLGSTGIWMDSHPRATVSRAENFYGVTTGTWVIEKVTENSDSSLTIKVSEVEKHLVRRRVAVGVNWPHYWQFYDLHEGESVAFVVEPGPNSKQVTIEDLSYIPVRWT